MNQNDNKRLYDAIREIAAKVCKDGETFLRADLAYELKQYGINADSIDVSRLAMEAYHYFNNDRNIERAFVTNDGRMALVDEYRMADMLDKGHPDDAMALARTELDKTSMTLTRLQRDIETNIEVAVAKTASNMMDVVTGVDGAKAVRAEASTLFDRYARMVGTYHEGEDTVRRNIADFTTLRTDIGASYQEFAMQLIDIYGDAIKMVAPNLFDFSKVQFLDVDSMLKHTELEYNRISDTCSALISEISDSFQTSLQSSAAAYRSAGKGNKTLGLAMAGLGLLSHYMNAGERTVKLRSDLTTFQTSVKHDATRIKADLGRLLVIYKTLNDVVIPKADIYMRYAAKLMSSDVKAITDAMYDNADIQPLEAKRRSLIAQMRALDGEINDHLQNIDVYQSLVSDLTQTLDSKGQAYRDALARKPSKPFFLINILTLGHANKTYARNYAEWDAVSYPLVREYESNQVDLKLDKDELTSHKDDVAAKQQEMQTVKQKLDEVNRDIRSKINASAEVQMKMLPHLRSAIAMLRLGREIMESKLDKRLMGTVEIPDFTQTEKLPADIENNLSMFTSTLADHLHADNGMAVALLNGIDDYRVTREDDRHYSDEDIAQVVGVSEQALQQGISLLDSALRLKAQQLNGRLAGAAYDEAFDKIAADFRKQIKGIDDKSAFVREVMRRANLAKNDDERKQAMLMLSELGGQSLSEQDFKDFINGKKQIIL
ncbi:MAG: hypothetical protein PUD58_05240 [Prevotella sp.]|uniref:hypothetical protein n=1 Tax=Prevotella sp. TaxID=59823 RepID=UPI002584DA92|nr:hypothetical protein [Prevotella sp.]MDD6853696.1 hypothetical protein [Prevotella sp.]